MSKYQEFRQLMRKIADVTKAIAVLNWDQETYLPSKSGELRAQQIATLAGIEHELSTSEQMNNLLNELIKDDSLSPKEKRNVEETFRTFNKKKKFDAEFVMEVSRVTAQSFEAWHKAKSADDFSIFEPVLKKMVDLKRQQAEIIGYDGGHPYDALLDDFEPGAKTADLEILFKDVRAQLVEFVKEIGEKEQVDDSWMRAFYEKDKQWDFGMDLLKQMGYSFEHGRQDIAPHPFTIDFGATDVRVTTRINENDFNEMTWSCIHEGGHALYEQGLPVEDYGLPTGMYLSLGLHESQSRLYENNIGRSLPYWKANFPKLQEAFQDNLGGVSADEFYKSCNIVKSSFIRTNADELTYHFHILIRFEIEKSLIEGSMEVSDIPRVWNEKYKEYLGIDVPSDAKGCLQDVHWSHGSFGYFPTYSLGSFYAAQFYNQAKKEINGLEDEIEKGNLIPLLDWLREKIHQYGRMYSADDLCVRITGEKLNFKYFMDYAKEKYGGIYEM